ncbi:MAG: NUDIX domain-containing protein [Alphaproteobacteria bacterium]|nr:NUDIX domain-containing protein [Alphaproteobacteria bacterium]
MSDKKFELIAREALFQGYFRVDRFHVKHESFAGGWTDAFSREILDRGARVAAVLLFDPQHDKIVMVEQFRAAAMAKDEDPWMLELVAGVLEPGEKPETAARREALEEAGCEVSDMQKIFGYYSSPGCVSEQVTLFVGRTSAPEDGIVRGVKEENEDIKVHVLDAAKAISYLYSGKLRDASSIIAMQWFAIQHTGLRSRWLVSEASTPII